uniref:Uncharacterized protein n=1 Tax=Vitis vinifera TaxID=29760 RepID=A5C8G7_VITVI|nr:hypothetical protein VITISV_031526 [Vitis vinifera]
MKEEERSVDYDERKGKIVRKETDERDFKRKNKYQGLNEGKAGKGGVYGRGGRVIASRRGLTVRVPAVEGGMLACNGAVGKRRLRRCFIGFSDTPTPLIVHFSRLLSVGIFKRFHHRKPLGMSRVDLAYWVRVKGSLVCFFEISDMDQQVVIVDQFTAAMASIREALASLRQSAKELTPEGAAWLMDLNGNRFSEPTNVDQLKRIMRLTMDDLMSPDFSDLSHIRCHTGEYSVSCEIYRSSRSCMLIPTCRMHTETRTCSLFYHSPSVKPLLEPSSQTRIFRHLVVVMLLILGDVPYGAFLKTFSQAHIFRYYHDYWVELLQQSISRYKRLTHCDISLSLVIKTDGLQDYVYSRFDHSDSLAKHILRLMESLLYLLKGWRVVAARYTGAYFSPHRFLAVWHSEPPSILGYDFRRSKSYLQFQRSEPSSLLILAFKATISAQFGVRSHYPFPIWHSEPPCLFGLAFRVAPSVRRSEPNRRLSIQSLLGFRVIIITSQFRQSKPSLLSISVQSHPHRILNFGVQSHHRFSVSVIRAITSQYQRSEPSSSHFQFRRSKSSSLLSFDVQSHHFSVRCSEPSSLPSLTFKCRILSLAFRAIIGFQLDIQSHIFSLAFRVVMIYPQFRRSEPSFTVQAFIAIVHIQAYKVIIFP